MLHNALGEMSPDQYRRFRASIIELVKADQQISLFEFVLQRILLTGLDRRFFPGKPPSVRYSHWGGVLQETADLVSMMIHVGHSDEAAAKQTFEKAVSAFNLPQQLVLRPRSENTLTRIHEALTKLAEAAPRIKKRLLSALIFCVAADEEVTVSEAELLRAVADSLDCPIPPIVPGPMAEENPVGRSGASN
jgi:hypothetical protein